MLRSSAKATGHDTCIDTESHPPTATKLATNWLKLLWKLLDRLADRLYATSWHKLQERMIRNGDKLCRGDDRA